MSSWPVEDIPDEDALFYRVPVGSLNPTDPQVHPGVFRENKGSMSVDWARYSTASETRARTGHAARFAIIKLVTGRVREIDGVSVQHSPVQEEPGQPDNRAHTDVFGMETAPSGAPIFGRKEKVRSELFDRFNTWEIPPNAP